MPNHSDRDAMANPSAGDVTSQSEAAMQDASVVPGEQTGQDGVAAPGQSASSLGPYPSYHGRTVSWVAVGLMSVGFIFGGLGLILGHGGPTWWPFWVGLGVAVLGLLVSLATNTLRRLVLNRPPAVGGRERPGPGVGSGGYAPFVARSPAPVPELKLTADDVRLLTLQAQGLIGARARAGGVAAMLRRVGAVQLDTISVLARSHELVAYARLGAVPRSVIERAYWNPRTASAFEYWSHAACVLPIEEWPYYAFRRRWFIARGKRWHDNHASVCEEVLAKLRSEGPLTTTDLGGAKNGGAWWDWSDTKIAVEWLLDTGEVICARRSGWRRIYDLPERVLAADLLNADPTDAECLIHLTGCGRQSPRRGHEGRSDRLPAAGELRLGPQLSRNSRPTTPRSLPAWSRSRSRARPGRPFQPGPTRPLSLPSPPRAAARQGLAGTG